MTADARKGTIQKKAFLFGRGTRSTGTMGAKDIKKGRHEKKREGGKPGSGGLAKSGEKPHS